jgi:hypothetical protein
MMDSFCGFGLTGHNHILGVDPGWPTCQRFCVVVPQCERE